MGIEDRVTCDGHIEAQNCSTGSSHSLGGWRGAARIIEDLEEALEQFRLIEADLQLPGEIAQ
jgi:hypothetical protein